MSKEKLLSTTEISNRLIGFPVPSEIFKRLGFEPAAETGNSFLWRESDLERMAIKLAGYVLHRANLFT